MSARRIVYTDGACSGNPGPGGWAWAAVPDPAFSDTPFAAGCEAQSTNQRMEIKAALEAARNFPEPLEIISDSTYVVNCFRNRWWEKWVTNGWVNSQKKPVANQDLWEPFITLYRAAPARLTFTWVKGHSGDPMNDLVDRLAVEAAVTQQPRAGTDLPAADELGPADTPGGHPGADIGPGGRDRRLPPGRLMTVFGHRPPELGGYEDNPTAAAVRRRLTEILVAKRQLHPDVHLVTGMALGAETLAAEAALDAAVPFIVIQPWPNPESVWPRMTKEHYLRLLGRAAGKVQLEKTVPDGKAKLAAALSRRDGWLAKQADEAVVVWDGKDAILAKLVRTLEDKLTDDVWIIDPTEAAATA